MHFIKMFVKMSINERDSVKRFIIFLGIFALIAWGGVWYSQKYEPRNDYTLTLYGNIDIREVDLGFRVFGRLQKMNMEEGDRVKEGDLLALLDKAPYQDLVEAAQAEVAEKKAAYPSALHTAQRKADLLKLKFATPEDAENAVSVKDQALAALDLSKANLSTALTNLKDTEVYSPTNGTILSRVKEPGSILNPGDVVYVVSLDSPIWARTYIAEPELGRIYLGMKAQVYTDSRPNNPYEAVVGFISPVAEFTPKTVETKDLRTKLVYRIRVIISQPDRYLKQGMPVTVVLDTRDEKAS
jgi:HlyD family secretion protein